jgi:dynactin complex subunit
MDHQTSPLFPGIEQAFERLAASPTCANVGRLQSEVAQYVDSYAGCLQPLLTAITAAFVESRMSHLSALSDEQFFALVEELQPSLLERQLLDDCDSDGNPVHEGKTTRAALKRGKVTPKARELFCAKAGMDLVDRVDISMSEIERLRNLFSSLASTHDRELRESLAKANEEAARRRVPMMRIPSF